eukprot:s237_g3.t1
MRRTPATDSLADRVWRADCRVLADEAWAVSLSLETERAKPVTKMTSSWCCETAKLTLQLARTDICVRESVRRTLRNLQLSISPWRSVQYRQNLVTEFLVLHLRYVPPCAGIAGAGQRDPGHTCREDTAGSEFGLSLLLRSGPFCKLQQRRPKKLDKDGWVQPPNVFGVRSCYQKLEFGAGDALLNTIGAKWDYCGREDLIRDLQVSFGVLCESKGADADKQNHPLLVTFASPGQGKSRFLSELPTMIEECRVKLNTEQVRKYQKTLAFLITCENGTSPGN